MIIKKRKEELTYDDNGNCTRAEVTYHDEMKTTVIWDANTNTEYLVRKVGGMLKPLSPFIPWVDKVETLYEQAEALIDDGFIAGSLYREVKLSPHNVCLHFIYPLQIPPQPHDIEYEIKHEITEDTILNLSSTWQISWCGTAWELLFLIHSYIACGSIPRMKQEIVYNWIITHFIRHETLKPFTVSTLKPTKSRAKIVDTKVSELLIEGIQSSYGARFDIEQVYKDIFQYHS